ncbi:hypothetical protein, partial [Liquorilactobacillus vini]|uniref:hypothetical protein n=1 Tax=Liquorilactobacillus vini TaxID=238015 RepID=UPI001F228D73
RKTEFMIVNNTKPVKKDFRVLESIIIKSIAIEGSEMIIQIKFTETIIAKKFPNFRKFLPNFELKFTIQFLRYPPLTKI